MSALRGTGALTRAYLIETWRSKPAIFWNLVFPLFTIVLFSLIFGGGDPDRIARIVPGTMTINFLAAAFFGVSMHMVSLRERELYRRFSATPLTALSVVVAHAITGFVNIAVSAVLQFLLVWLAFGVSIHSSLPELALVVLIGAFAFIPLGLIVGSIARDMRSAPAISNLLFFPLSFLSGAAMPLFLMPQWMQKLATLLPSTYFVELLLAAVVREHPFSEARTAAAILLLTGVVAFACDALLFRWESSQPLNRRALALVIALLAVIYGAAFLYGVKLESARTPEEPGVAEDANLGADVRILRGMTIIDGAGGRIERGQISIEGDRITAVGPARKTPKGVPVTDLSGLYVMPGLIDSHIHLGGSAGSSATPEEFTPARLIHDLQAYLALGVTTIVSMTDHVEDMQNLQRDVAAGRMRAPRVFLSGPGITAVGGHPAKMFSFMPGFAAYMTRQVDSPAAAEEAVRELAGMRVDIIKLYLEAGWEGETLPMLGEAELRAAIRTAHELKLRTTVHVDSDRSARMAIDAGTDGIEHVPPDLSDATIAVMVAKKVTLTPTIVAWESLSKLAAGAPVVDELSTRWVQEPVIRSLSAPSSWIVTMRQSPENVAFHRQRYEKARGALRRAVAGGVIVLAGSDAGNAGTFHGPALLRELELLVSEGGMQPSVAIAAATSAAASRLGRNDLGRIAQGAVADLVVLQDDPEKDISAVRKVRAVYRAGAPLNRSTLLSTSPGRWMPTFAFPSEQ
ncbi:MAG: amidohydrolase family protein [Thermoanaerobaculia bacterium]